MTVSLCEVGRRGRLDLTFTFRGGRTQIKEAYCEIPFKVTRLHETAAGMAHLTLMHCTAGLFGGDTAECTIEVQPGARVLITQQSATKIHPANGEPAIQRNRIHVASGGEIHIHYDAVIPFAGARAEQTTLIDLEPGSRLYFWEGLMAGRVGRGEIWEFEEFSSETRVALNGHPVFLDRFCLLPRQCSPQAEWMMGDNRYFGTGLCFSGDAASLAGRLHEALPVAGVDTPSPGLTAVRVVAANGPDFHRCHSIFARITGYRAGEHDVPPAAGT